MDNEHVTALFILLGVIIGLLIIVLLNIWVTGVKIR